MKHRIRFRVIHSAGKEEKLLINLAEGESFDLNHELLGLQAVDGNQPFLVEFRIVQSRAQITLKDSFFSLLLNGKAGSKFILRPGDVMSVSGSILEFLEVPNTGAAEAETKFVDIRAMKKNEVTSTSTSATTIDLSKSTPIEMAPIIVQETPQAVDFIDTKVEPTFNSLVDYKPSSFQFEAPEPSYQEIPKKQAAPVAPAAQTTSEPKTQTAITSPAPAAQSPAKVQTRQIQIPTAAPVVNPPQSAKPTVAATSADFSLPSLESTAEITRTGLSSAKIAKETPAQNFQDFTQNTVTGIQKTKTSTVNLAPPAHTGEVEIETPKPKTKRISKPRSGPSWFETHKKKLGISASAAAAVVAAAILGPQYIDLQNLKLPFQTAVAPQAETNPAYPQTTTPLPQAAAPPSPMTAAPAVATSDPALDQKIAALKAQVQQIQEPVKMTILGQKKGEVPSVGVNAPTVDQQANRNTANDANTNDENSPRKSMFMAVKNGNLSTVKKYIDSGKVGVNATDTNGRTALMGAAFFGQLSISKYLISKGARVSTADRNGDTALIHAVQNRHASVASFLMSQGANAHFTNHKGQSAVGLAKISGNKSILAAVTSRNSNRAIASKPKGQTYKAVEGGSRSITKVAPNSRKPSSLNKPSVSKPVLNRSTPKKPTVQNKAGFKPSTFMAADDDLPAPPTH